MESRRWPLLDLVRFGAALLVVFGHVRGLLLVGIDRVENPTIPIKLFYLITGAQHEAVVIFFVVSGFLVGGPAFRLIKEGSFDYTTYFTNRFSRIFIVYYPALLLVAILSAVGGAAFSATRFYAERPLFPTGLHSAWTVDQIPCHLLSVQGVMCEAWGQNLVFWTLGYEWVLYLIAPVIFLAVARRAAPLGIVALLGLYVLNRICPGFNDWLLFWLIGVAAYEAGRELDLSPAVGIAGASLCLAAMIAARAKLALSMTDITIAIGIGVLFSCRSLVGWKLDSSIIRRGSGFSYSLYAVHVPVCLFFGGAIEAMAGWPSHLVQPTLGGLAVFGVTIAVALSAARLFAMVTEDRTDDLRHFLRGALRRMAERRLARSTTT
jgi:peptidoglycan/LPS O-acetylase OafA/YrhL